MSRNSPSQLHPVAVRIFEFIVEFKSAHDGIAPSMRELVENVEGVSSTSMARWYVDQLERFGAISVLRLPDGTGAARAIQICEGSWRWRSFWSPRQVAESLEAPDE